MQFVQSGRSKPDQLRVLIADDEAGLRDVLGRFLEQKGCAVWRAANGEEALALCGVAEPDVVISDLTMPRLDGLAFWQRACAVRSALCRRWVVLSAQPLPAPMAAAGLLYLQKPADLDAIWAAVRVAAG